MKEWKNIVIGLLGLLLIGSLFMIKTGQDESEIYETVIKRKHKQEILLLERQLESSNGIRDSIVLRYNSLNRDYENLLRVDSVKTKALQEIPGKFKNLSSKQLEDEMLRRYNVRQIN